MIETRGSSTLFDSVSRVNLEKEYHLSLRVLKFEEPHFGAKLPLSMKVTVTVCPAGEPQMLQERGSSPLFTSFK
jgi:hypothetical protein